MPGVQKAKNDKTHKKLKQAQLPFKVLSPVTTAPAAGAGKSHPIKKRPFTKDEPGGTNAALPKKAKTSSESDCVEVTSSSDEPRATSPRRRPRAPLDQFVRIEAPVSEVSTSCDLVDLTSENKENRVEPTSRDVEMTEPADTKVHASEDAETTLKAIEDAETTLKASEDAETTLKASEDAETTLKASEDAETTLKASEDAETTLKASEDAETTLKASEDAEITVKASEDAKTVKTTANKYVGAADVGGNTKKSREEAAEVKAKKSGDTDASEKKAEKKEKKKTNSDVCEVKSEESSDEPENVAVSPDSAETQTDAKSDASEVDSPASSDAAKVKASGKSDLPQVKTGHDAKAPSAVSAKDADAVTSETEDEDSAKTPEPSPDAEVTGDASDSDKDGDADDESADDVVVLDDTKLKPSEGGDAGSADGKTSASTTPTTKRTDITKKKTPKQKERERIRAKREQEKQEEKQRRDEEKEKLRKEKQDQKEKERKEKEEKREKDRNEKEEKKEKERLEKEKEKTEKQKQKEAEKQKLSDEKKQAKEEKNRKDEEKRKAEEEEQRQKQKAKSMFSSFFVKKPKEAEGEPEEQKEEDNKLFQEFRVKEDMVLAPGARTALSARQSSLLERALAAPERPGPDQLYLAELRSGRRQLQTRSRTLPKLEKDIEIIEEDDEDKELDGLAQDIVLSSAAAGRQLRYKLLMFRENRRPAYWGTWSKRCPDVKGRRPLGKAQILNYDEDSDDDWEEEDPNGESLSGSEKEVESEDDYEVDNEVFVPHGYLSDEEIKDEEEMISPEAQKARLKEKGEEFEKQMKKKTTALKPRLIGCVWQDNSNTDPMFQQLLKLLRPFVVRSLSELPVPTAASGEVDGTPLAGPSPSDTPASFAQGGHKFLKKFPDEALLPLARLVHGSTRGKPLLVREFATFWKRRAHGGSPRKADSAAAAPPQTPPSAADGTPTAHVGPMLSKKKIEDKLCDIAAYTRCTAEGALQGRCCWMVRDDVLATLGAELPLPSQWKWITKTAVRRSIPGVTPGASPAAALAAVAPMETEGTPGRPRPATSLITKFTKVVTAEQARSDLLSPPSKRKIVPTKLISPQAPVVVAPPALPAQPGIATFFKASPAGQSPSATAVLMAAAAAAGGTPKRRLAPIPVGPRPGPSSAAAAAAAAPARRLALTPVSAGSSAAPARRLAPVAVPSGLLAARRLVPTPVAAGSSKAARSTPVSVPVPAKAPEQTVRKITLISVPRGLPQLKVAAAPVPASPAAVPASPAAAAEPVKAAPAAANVETITLE